MSARGAMALAAVLPLAAAGCAGRQTPVAAWAEPEAASVGDAGTGADSAAPWRSAEIAWLCAHLADDADRRGESPSVRRLVASGHVGARAAVEVFRVGDSARAPFALRVVEGVALRGCGGDAARAGAVMRWLRSGDASGVAPRRDEARWPVEAVERARSWAGAGSPCRSAEGGDAGDVTDAVSSRTIVGDVPVS